MIGKSGTRWSEEEKEIIMTSDTSHEAVERYFTSFPRSTRSIDSIYTYYAWKHNEWGKKPIEGPIEVGDIVQYAPWFGNPKSPTGVVINATMRRGVPLKSQKILVRFGNYTNREVYAGDYRIVKKGIKK